MKKILLSVAFVVATITGANAQQTISFEASEGFTLGDINGQNGWVVTGDGAGGFISNQNVTSDLASEGTQALKIAVDSNFGTQSNPVMGAFYNYSTPVEFETAVISFDIYIVDEIDDASDYRFGTVNLTAGFFTTILHFSYNGAVAALSNEAFTTTDFTWTPETWYNVRVETTANDVSYYINDVLIHQGVQINNQLNDIEQVRFVHDNWSGVDGYAIIDNFKTNDEDASTGNFTASSFSVYPNPAKDVLNISNSINAEINSVIVTDINGRTVKQANSNVSQINVSDLNAGVYFVNINSNEGSTTKKIVKQ